jgi:hypothetical protein
MEMSGHPSWGWSPVARRVDHSDPRDGCCDDGFRGGRHMTTPAVPHHVCSGG